MFKTIIVKRGKKGDLQVISGAPSENAIRSFFSGEKTVENYVGKATNKVSQCSVINDFIDVKLTEGTKLTDLAKDKIFVSLVSDKLIKMKLFPSDPSKYDYDDLKIDKACKVRVNRHLASLQGKGISSGHAKALKTSKYANA